MGSGLGFIMAREDIVEIYRYPLVGCERAGRIHVVEFSEIVQLMMLEEYELRRREEGRGKRGRGKRGRGEEGKRGRGAKAEATMTKTGNAGGLSLSPTNQPRPFQLPSSCTQKWRAVTLSDAPKLSLCLKRTR